MLNLVSTYRVQFHKGFSFHDFEKLIPYLHKLGIKTIYASPIFEAVPGSVHGYDVVNPHRINPEIGTIEQLINISKQLKNMGMCWLQDIVPNHMAFDVHNPWLMDVLEKGRLSKFAEVFDILWDSHLYAGRLMVPFLGEQLKDAIDTQKIQLKLQDNILFLSYLESYYPVNIETYATILKKVSNPSNDVTQLIKIASTISTLNDAVTLQKQSVDLKKKFSLILQKSDHQQIIIKIINDINDDDQLLSDIVDNQHYQLCYWQETDVQINYRRFFTVNGLICLNIQQQGVFDLYHQYIKTLLEEEIFDGLRVDHVDGLFDPEQYLNRLRQMAGDDIYIIVEKILEEGEPFPIDWPVNGNTGYDFLALTNNLFTNAKSKKKFTSFYQKLTGDDLKIREGIIQKKTDILIRFMAGELDNLLRLFISLGLTDKNLDSDLLEDLKLTLGQFLIRCPVYRYYGNQFPLNDGEAQSVKSVLSSITEANPGLKKSVKLLEDVFLNKPNKNDVVSNQKALSFYQRLMQFTGPLMAKGVEDTLMYTYNRFAGHNEVGDAPSAFGIAPSSFHQLMIERQEKWPLSLNATSTHDTKRGEDVRARLNVLSDFPDEWITAVKQWMKLNAHLKSDNAPDANDEYLIYQTIIGALPMPGQEDDFKARLGIYIQKALREGKINSNWAKPNEKYEQETINFAHALLNKDTDFYKSFEKFHQKVCDYGIINSLSHVLLKMTCPGIPDTYQGCEAWDLSLVDPDNRRSIKYPKNQKLFNDIDQLKDLLALWTIRYEGGIKVWLTQKLLKARADDVALFQKGDYIPLTISGKFKENVFAYARSYRDTWYVTVIPLHLAAINPKNEDILVFDWENTSITMPTGASGTFINILNNEEYNCDDTLSVSSIFQNFPLAFLKFQQKPKNRRAGVLLHITSLPSKFGIGDLGTKAYSFVRQLKNCGQTIWQMLPVNPTHIATDSSPYSSTSSMAGNVLLISPETLIEEGLLTLQDVKKIKVSDEDTVDYFEVTKVKSAFYDIAYDRFTKADDKVSNKKFNKFKIKESYWLDDFALYEAIKCHQDDKPWYQWQDEFKCRDEAALQKIASELEGQIEKIKWLQFVFHSQWHRLKEYCTAIDITILGDMPFYIGHDSADVWANQDIFKLDDHGNMAWIAGVPPDYFNAEGQLWGMPVFNWEVLKSKEYDWWIKRIRRNMEFFDLIRLDHFRAFSSYWEVSAGETTARNGAWKTGPGKDFFEAVKKQIGSLPFVAEDLGDVNEDVLNLRDEFALPGMRVLQFAFGDDMAKSYNIPHHYPKHSFAYTGTHDNNTASGWYQSVDKKTKKHLKLYTGFKVTDKTVSKVLCKLCYASVADTAVLPMQDILGLDEKARMNTPATTNGNWKWRLFDGQFDLSAEEKLKKWVKLFDR